MAGQRAQLASGRFAFLDDGRGAQQWGVSWEFGRQRGPSIA
ncbi:hypothetical protein [Thiobacillus denitrificans]|nr:hypothetical protein [Thiobacillus denitrificans]